MDKKILNNLLIDIQSGNELAFEKLFNYSNKSVFTFVYSFIKHKETAEDLTQDTFIKIKRFIYSYKPNTNPSAWILQIAKNISIDFIKKYKNETTIDISQFEIMDKKNNSPENNLLLHDILNKYLSIEDRQIVLLHDIHGYKNKEIAKFLNMPIGTVLWKYNRAMKLLKTKYKEESK